MTNLTTQSLKKIRRGIPVTSLHKREALQMVRSVDKRRADGDQLPAVKAVPQKHADGWRVVRADQAGRAV